jgi:hypothetical protein
MKNTQSQFQITLLYDVAYLFNLFRSNNKGNFLEILHWSAQTDSLVKAILEDSSSNATYLSPYIQNELLHLMAEQIRHRISEKVFKRKFGSKWR